MEALEHPWVRPGGCAPDTPLEGTVVSIGAKLNCSVDRLDSVKSLRLP